jgi:hypothetical protein
MTLITNLKVCKGGRTVRKTKRGYAEGMANLKDDGVVKMRE